VISLTVQAPASTISFIIGTKGRFTGFFYWHSPLICLLLVRP
jgi:hypothetical protein